MTARTDPSAPIAITLGDPCGIGPEIIARTVTDLAVDRVERLRLFGDRTIVDRAFASCTGRETPTNLDIVDRGLLSADQAVLGKPNQASGAAQVAYLEAAAKAAQAGSINAVVTAPINKTAARAAGFAHVGQTEFFAERLGAERYAMMFDSPKMRVALATVHQPLAEVPGALTVDGIAGLIELAAAAVIDDFGVTSPTIGVLGLNPHAGEGGMFGREEIEVIAPAIEQARRSLGSRGSIAGPLVPDAAFRGDYDLFIAMYHDQALIPLKLVAFDSAVNVTIGLSVPRTSPDHGVGYDIAGLGLARHQSFARALDLAFDIADRRALRS